jgi:hypothetical protein
LFSVTPKVVKNVPNVAQTMAYNRPQSVVPNRSTNDASSRKKKASGMTLVVINKMRAA